MSTEEICPEGLLKRWDEELVIQGALGIWLPEHIVFYGIGESALTGENVEEHIYALHSHHAVAIVGDKHRDATHIVCLPIMWSMDRGWERQVTRGAFLPMWDGMEERGVNRVIMSVSIGELEKM